MLGEGHSFYILNIVYRNFFSPTYMSPSFVPNKGANCLILFPIRHCPFLSNKPVPLTPRTFYLNFYHFLPPSPVARES